MIAIKAFAGEYPRQKPTLLPDGAAQSAVDCDFGQTVLTGIRERQLFGALSLPGNIKSFYVHDVMFTWPYEVDVVRGPVSNDAYRRFYWADGSNYYVSRGDIGTGAQEPSPTNRYKVGVPCPAAPLTIAPDALPLTLPDTATYAFSAIYETAAGAVLSEHDLGSATELVEHLPASIIARWDTSFSNTIGDAASGTQTGVTGLYYDSFQSGFHVMKDQNVDLSIIAIMGINNFTGTVYFHHDDYLNVPLPLKNGKCAMAYSKPSALGGMLGGETQVLYFYPIGDGWYATRSGATLPEGAASATTAATVGTLAILMTTTLSSGALLKTIIRLDGNDSVPSEYADFDFTFAASDGALTLTIKSSDDTKEFRAYTYTYVNQWGEESGYAAPATIDIAEGQAVQLGYTVLPDDSGYCPIQLIRIYRTATGASGTNYSFVDEFIPSATNPVYVDSKDGDELGPGSTTAAFEPPPQNLRGLCVMSNGIVAGFVGNELYFMEPYLPYAYNPSYAKPLPYPIVGLCPTDDGLYVTTTAYPFLVTGVSPDAMVDRRVPSIQAGVSKRSICSIGSSVAYASNDGLVLLRGIDASLELSTSFFTREVWRERYADKLSHMRLDAHDGNLVVWFDDGTPGFLIRTEGTPTLTRLTDPVYASFVFTPTDGLYVSAGYAIYEFKGSDTAKPFTWWSKDYIAPKPVNFGCVQLIGSGAVAFTVFADGAPVHTQTVSLDGVGQTVYRLPAGFLARRWSIQLAGAYNTTVSECTLAFSPSELQSG